MRTGMGWDRDSFPADTGGVTPPFAQTPHVFPQVGLTVALSLCPPVSPPTDPHNLWIRCSVNGRPMQDSSTQHLIFGVPALIAWVSRFVTLVPGDILLTGTPAGVGFFRKPPVFLKPGDEVQCEIEELGTICNRVV
ncbi:fumarylacetoacetate hydrolase domain-containing protein 2-like [Neopelma chrysocephalum]|uniref:fumarylacetoacetate hydrolase domain-containing protein 2-like n=1 Tax=Neopelma chrysocephalum TaxID=114329 RepID=UPI000FCD3959|nr:fumarylacetoacetate hydrolase domain-containing protein 2-like [Neopelma chrysocephalum]